MILKRGRYYIERGIYNADTGMILDTGLNLCLHLYLGYTIGRVIVTEGTGIIYR